MTGLQGVPFHCGSAGTELHLLSISIMTLLINFLSMRCRWMVMLHNAYVHLLPSKLPTQVVMLVRCAFLRIIEAHPEDGDSVLLTKGLRATKDRTKGYPRRQAQVQ